MAGGFQTTDGPAQIIAGFLNFGVRLGVCPQVFFHTLPLSLRPLDIDIFRPLRNFCQHDYAARKDLGEPPMDGHVTLFTVLPVLERSSLKFSQERGVAGKDTQITFFPGDGNLVHFLLSNLAVRSDNLQLDNCGKHVGHSVTVRRNPDLENPAGCLLCLQPLRFFKRLLDGPDHIEGLLGDLIVFTFNDLLEPADSIFQFDVPALQAGELLGHKEGLR
jgi:hypothetical protein